MGGCPGVPNPRVAVFITTVQVSSTMCTASWSRGSAIRLATRDDRRELIGLLAVRDVGHGEARRGVHDPDQRAAIRWKIGVGRPSRPGCTALR